MLSTIPERIYEAISFTQGQEPNYELLQSFFIPEGLFINNKGETAAIFGVKAYIDSIKEHVDRGAMSRLEESELGNTVWG